MIDQKLLAMLVCPMTKGALQYDKANQELVCLASGLVYPIKDDVPVMIASEARELNDEERDHWAAKVTS